MRDDGFDAAFARSGEEAMRRNASRGPDAVVVDASLSDMTAAELVPKLRQRSPGLPAVIVHRDGADVPEPSRGASALATSCTHVEWPLELGALYAEIGGVFRRSISIAI
jgi:DNA-binding response OmpR family regulator